MASATFTPNPQIEAAREKLVALVSTAEYGNVFSFDELKETTGLEPVRLYQLISSVNNKTLPSKKMLLSVRGHGYKVALPTEQLTSADSRRVRAGRQIHRGIKEATFVDTSGFTAEEKVRRVHLLNKCISSLAVIRRPAEKALKAQQTAIRHQEHALAELKRIEGQIEQLKAGLVQ